MEQVKAPQTEWWAVYIEKYDVIPIVCHIDDKTEYTVYYLSDYTEELAKENHIVSQDSNFSLKACENLVNKVWNKPADLTK